MLQELANALREIQSAAAREFEVGSEENRRAMFEAREAKGKSPEAPRFRQMAQAYRTPQALGAAFGRPQDPDYIDAREKLGIEFDVSTMPKRIGTGLGAIASDLIQDRGRGFYWLLNAAQATGDMIAEEVIARARPDLYAVDKVDGKVRRRYGPTNVQALAAPAGYAINTGLGLMTPFGGAEGYKAAIPDAEDPSKTANVLAEVGAKYILGRTGDLLPYDEFVKVRPDVSKDEYQRYKAFKFDKRTDLNPFDDGNFGLGMGALKYTDEGIHGPEIQFLGRSLPMTTGVVPFATATAGSALGARYGGAKPIRRGFMGGVAGLLGGNVIGNAIEGERRRRNAAENELDTL